MLLMPMTLRPPGPRQTAEVVNRFTIATRMTLQLTFPTAVAFALFSTDITDVWLGSDAPDVTAGSSLY